MKAPCYKCSNRREVEMAPDGKLYCEQCFPRSSKDTLGGMFGDETLNNIFDNFNDE